MTACGAPSPADVALCSSRASCHPVAGASTLPFRSPFRSGRGPLQPPSRHTRNLRLSTHSLRPCSARTMMSAITRLASSSLKNADASRRVARRRRARASRKAGRSCGTRNTARASPDPHRPASACRSSGGSDGTRPRSRRSRRGCASAASTCPCGIFGPRVSNLDVSRRSRGGSFSSDRGAPPCEEPPIHTGSTRDTNGRAAAAPWHPHRLMRPGHRMMTVRSAAGPRCVENSTRHDRHARCDDVMASHGLGWDRIRSDGSSRTKKHPGSLRSQGAADLAGSLIGLGMRRSADRLLFGGGRR